MYVFASSGRAGTAHREALVFATTSQFCGRRSPTHLVHLCRQTCRAIQSILWLMPNYRRSRIPGATLFFTVVACRRRPILASPAAVQVLRECVALVKDAMPFAIDAWVVLPDHMHAIWTLPDNDADYSRRWGRIKAEFTRRSGIQHESSVGRQAGVWQPRFWEHLIRDERDLATHMHYLHFKSGQTWLGSARPGLAVLQFSPPRTRWAVSRRLGMQRARGAPYRRWRVSRAVTSAADSVRPTFVNGTIRRVGRTLPAMQARVRDNGGRCPPYLNRSAV
jgi:putative transposase